MTQFLPKVSLSGQIAAIPSKSMAHRLLIAAALAKGPTAVACRSLSKDIAATADCLRGLGARITWEKGVFQVEPGKPQGLCVLPCGESGSTLRFLLPVAVALGVDAEFHMEGRLPERPLAPLDGQLEAHGVSLSRPVPQILRCSGQLKPGTYVLPGNVSSQYISGLLFALPLLEGKSTLTVTGTVESAPYIAMTRQALGQFQIETKEENQIYTIDSQAYESPGQARVEGDWSNSAFWLCAGALGAPVTVTGLDRESLQGDQAVLEILRRFGARVEGTTVSPGALHGVDIDAKAVPDLVPVLSVVAAAAEGTTRIYNGQRLRMKESDRIASVAAMLTNLGASVEEQLDGLLIHGGKALTGGKVDSCNDHRIAMSAAVASLLCPVEVEGAQAVEKSYPQFWEDYKKLASNA